MSNLERVYKMKVADVYPHYITKAERKGRTKAEVVQIIQWLTGYDKQGLAKVLRDGVNLEDFFSDAPELNQSRNLITGVVCGVRVEDVEDPIMREVRYLDKLVDELAKGKSMDKILRSPGAHGA